MTTASRHRSPQLLPCIARLIGVLALISFGTLHSAQARQAPAPVELTLGTSTQGRPITAVRFGNGPRKLVLVGATHGYPERNTFELVTQLAEHFKLRPEAVPDAISLYIIPLLNPDGLALQTRFNANRVDLNRNMDTSADDCPENDWQHIVAGAYGLLVDTGGPYSESEVESQLIRDFLLDADGVIFFHSNAGVVFPACAHEPSALMGRIYADGAGYAFIPKWDRYLITGGMHDWAGGLGIAAITPELITGDLPEFEQNLGGVRAILNAAEGILPPAQPRTESGIDVHPIIWRAWKAWGGPALFGQPLGPATPTQDGWVQLFERARLEYNPAQGSAASSVRSGQLGRELLAPAQNRPEAPVEDARFFPETQHNVRSPFSDFWQINGGLPIFGLPLTSEEQSTDEAGDPVTRQIFERAVLQRPLDGIGVGDVSLMPLGRLQWAQADAQSVETSIKAR